MWISKRKFNKAIRDAENKLRDEFTKQIARVSELGIAQGRHLEAAEPRAQFISKLREQFLVQSVQDPAIVADLLKHYDDKGTSSMSDWTYNQQPVAQYFYGTSGH